MKQRAPGRRDGRFGALDETGQEKTGAGHRRGEAPVHGLRGPGRERDQHGAPVLCAGEAGHALIGARQWIPREHIEDPVKSLVTGLPLDLAFRTKGQLAIDICLCRADGLEFDFICGNGFTAAAPSCESSSKPMARLRACWWP